MTEVYSSADLPHLQAVYKKFHPRALYRAARLQPDAWPPRTGKCRLLLLFLARGICPDGRGFRPRYILWPPFAGELGQRERGFQPQ